MKHKLLALALASPVALAAGLASASSFDNVLPGGTFSIDDDDFENYYDVNGNGVVDAGDRFLQFIEFNALNAGGTTAINSDPEVTGVAAYEVLSTSQTGTQSYILASGGSEDRAIGNLELGKLSGGDTIFTFLDSLTPGLGTGLQTNVQGQGSTLADPLGFIFSDSTDDITTSLQEADLTYANLSEILNVTSAGDLEYTLDFDAADGDRVGGSGFLLQLAGAPLDDGQNLGNLGTGHVTIAEEFTPGFYAAQSGSRPDFRIQTGSFFSRPSGLDGEDVAATSGIASNVTLRAVRIPTPSTGLLLGLGLIALGGVLRQRGRMA